MTSANSDTASGHYLVGDIGGTNARFAFVEPGSATPTPLAKYRVADFANFEKVLEQLIGDWRNQDYLNQVLRIPALPLPHHPI